MRSPSRPRALARLLPVALLALTSFVTAAPSLGLAGWIRPFVSPATLAAYRTWTVPLGLDLAGGTSVTYRVEGEDPALPGEVARVLRRRLSVEDVPGATVRVQGRDELEVQVPCPTDEECRRLRRALELTDLLGVHEVVAMAPSPLGLPEVPGTRALPVSGTDPETPAAWVALRDPPALTGAALRAVEIGFDPMTGSPQVILRTTAEGREVLATMTRRLRGRRVAVALAGEVVSVAGIEHEIRDGRAALRGDFEVEEARALVRLMGAGALPAPLIRLASSTVGPGLGAEDLEAGLAAGALGIAGVGVFMTACYRGAGLAAMVGLGLNLLMQVGCLQVLDAALTLPGLAGVVLGVGMSVDAAVIAFERIREEQSRGRTPARARRLGFSRAAPAILDSNLTTLLTAAILFGFGTGPVRGFAVTLGVGIVCSLVVALGVLPRLLDGIGCGDPGEAR